MFRNNPTQKFVVDPTVTPHHEATFTEHTNSVMALRGLPDGRLASGYQVFSR